LQSVGGEIEGGLPAHSELDLPSKWIVSRLNGLIESVQRLFDVYQYGEAGRQIYEFMWHEFADWYVEFAKASLYGEDTLAKTHTLRVLVHVLDSGLRLLHPFMPFVTEDLWSYLPVEGEALIIARWCQADARYIDAQAESDMMILIDLIRGIRNTRDEYSVEPKIKLKAFVKGGSHTELLRQYGHLFGRVPNSNVNELYFMEDHAEPSENVTSIVVNDVVLYIPLAGMVDVEAECERLNREREKVVAGINRVEGLLGNEGFVKKAPEAVLKRERDTLLDLQMTLQKIDERISQLCS